MHTGARKSMGHHKRMNHNRISLHASMQLDDDVLEELAGHPTVAKLGKAVYTPKGLRLFLTSPSARFEGRTALELMRSGEEERVVSALASDYEAIS